MDQADRRRSTGRRLAALGALSSAGLAVTATQAEAGIIVTTVNQDIGFAADDVSSVALSALPGGNSQVYIGRGMSGGGSRALAVSGVPGNHFRIADSFPFGFFGPPFAQLFGKGATLGQAHHLLSGGFITIANTNSSALGPFSNAYFLFSFKDGGQTLYGWIYGSLTDSTYNNMTYDLISYAYDDSGAVIAAGAVPEPETAVLGLIGGALIGGAAGVRRWKKARAEAATA